MKWVFNHYKTISTKKANKATGRKMRSDKTLIELGAARGEQSAALTKGTRVRVETAKRTRLPVKGKSSRAANLAQNIPRGGRPIKKRKPR